MLSLRVSPFRSAKIFCLAFDRVRRRLRGAQWRQMQAAQAGASRKSTKPTPTVEGILEVINDYIENWRPYLYTALRSHWHDPTILGRMRRVHGRERCLCCSVS